ncbi:MAG: right-handed parallel beta-helix repeat-containing protein [Planctomycetota bacterium]
MSFHHFARFRKVTTMLAFRLTLLAILAHLLLTVGAAAKTIYCAPDESVETTSAAGSPRGETSERPFVDIAAALDEAEPGDRIVLLGGEYRLGEPLKFPRGGEPDRPITLAAADGEHVALLGSVRLSDWQRHDDRIWKHPAPPRPIKGLYEDGVRLTHPRQRAQREHPPLASLTGPGQWTVVDDSVYVWCRDGGSPADHRVEASQHSILHLNRPWLRAEGLHILFGQPTGLVISADHCEAHDCEIAHVSNSVDNAYGAYFYSCSNSALRRCTIHDSYYWGDHGSNSHLVSCINCGDDGPNLVEQCAIFNGGLGVGTKGAARQMVIKECHVFDVRHGVVISGRRRNGPGAGKTDRGHYLILNNHFHDGSVGVYFYSGGSTGNRVVGNVIERCDRGIHQRDVRGLPQDSEIVNNVIANCSSGIFLVAGRDGHPTLDRFAEADFRSHHNLYYENDADWRNPLTWSSALEPTLDELRQREPSWEQGSLNADPQLDRCGRAKSDSPTLGSGVEFPLPEFIADETTPPNIGLGPPGHAATPCPWQESLVLSIAGSDTGVVPGEPLDLKATLHNTTDREVPLGESCLVTFHFRYADVYYFDRQEVWRTRLQLPTTSLAAGQDIVLSDLGGWQPPMIGEGDDSVSLSTERFFLEQGVRLRATVQFLSADENTADALARTESLLRSCEVPRLSPAKASE